MFEARWGGCIRQHCRRQSACKDCGGGNIDQHPGPIGPCNRLRARLPTKFTGFRDKFEGNVVLHVIKIKCLCHFRETAREAKCSLELGGPSEGWEPFVDLE